MATSKLLQQLYPNLNSPSRPAAQARAGKVAPKSAAAPAPAGKHNRPNAQAGVGNKTQKSTPARRNAYGEILGGTPADPDVNAMANRIAGHVNRPQQGR